MKRRANRKGLRIAAYIAGTLCLLIALLFLLQAWQVSQNQEGSLTADRDQITYQGVKYTQRKDLDTVLMMGLDKFEADEVSGKYLNHQQSDFLLLIAVDRKQKSYSILHLNRDTMTDISVLGEKGERIGSVNQQLALAHTYGTGGRDSCRNAAEAVSNLLHGVKVDHYVSMTMDAVATLNDLAGGVTLEVMDDFSQVYPSLVQGETITLKGQQALTYVRTRRNLEDSSNLHRMERQRQYLTALREQINVKKQEDADFLAKSMTKVADYLVSDLTVNQMSMISDRMDSYTFTGFQTLKGEAVKGEKYMEYHVDQDALMKTVLELYFEPAK